MSQTNPNLSSATTTPTFIFTFQTIFPPAHEKKAEGDSVNAQLVSSDDTGFYIEKCMLEGHGTVFRDMFSVQKANSPPQTPTSPSNGNSRPHILEVSDTTFETAQTISTVLFILEDDQ
ncbi:hypothetical protein IAR50_006112 [Cryptococcus sp. DSM 104548]